MIADSNLFYNMHQVALAILSPACPMMGCSGTALKYQMDVPKRPDTQDEVVGGGVKSA